MKQLAGHRLLPLLMCFAKGKEPVNGRTRMQKMIFVTEMKLRLGQLQFQPADYGPFSWRLSSDIDFLVETGMIRENEMSLPDGSVKYEYQITKEGSDYVRKAASEDGAVAKILTTMEGVKREYNHQPLSSLLRQIYDDYPEYATKSRFEF